MNNMLVSWCRSELTVCPKSIPYRIRQHYFSKYSKMSEEMGEEMMGEEMSVEMSEKISEEIQ